MIRNSSVNNKVPFSRRNGSHCRFVSQILPVYLNIYFPHTDMLLDFHMSPVNRFNIHSFALVSVIVSFFALDASSLQSVTLSWKADHIALQKHKGSNDPGVLTCLNNLSSHSPNISFPLKISFVLQSSGNKQTNMYVLESFQNSF